MSKERLLAIANKLCFVCRGESVLVEAISAASKSLQSGGHIAAHQGKRRKKAAMDPVSKLEEDLLRASHGIEAELYLDL